MPKIEHVTPILRVADVTASVAYELRRRGADIRQPPTTFEWGVREMNVADLDGHRLRFSMTADQQADGIPFVEG